MAGKKRKIEHLDGVLTESFQKLENKFVLIGYEKLMEYIKESFYYIQIPQTVFIVPNTNIALLVYDWISLRFLAIEYTMDGKWFNKDFGIDEYKDLMRMCMSFEDDERQDSERRTAVLTYLNGLKR